MRTFLLSLLFFLRGVEPLEPLYTPHPIPTGQCEDLQNEFIQNYNSLSGCFISYAPSGGTCLECKINFNFLKDTFRKIRKSIQEESSNLTCYDVLCRQNSIGVVCSDFKYIHRLWDESKCNYCYQNNSASSDFLKPDVGVYISLVNNVTDCFEMEDNVCVNCQDSYRQLSRMFFHEWYTSSVTGSYQCRDIYDKYNVTMRKWSEVYGCIREPRESFWGPSILLFFYIVVLYISFYALVIIGLPNMKWLKLGDLKSRTEVLPIDIPIRSLRPEGSPYPELSFEEITEEMSCPCFNKFTRFVQEYRDAREDFRREDPPEVRIVAAIHKKHGDSIHRSRNFQF